jgi:hypothetical protein
MIYMFHFTVYGMFNKDRYRAYLSLLFAMSIKVSQNSVYHLYLLKVKNASAYILYSLAETMSCSIMMHW